MPKIGNINSTLTENAKRVLLDFISSSNLENPIIGIDKGKWEHESEEHWGYGAYTTEQIEKAAPEIEGLGHTLLYNLDGLTVACAQFHLLNELNEKTIDIENGKLVIT